MTTVLSKRGFGCLLPDAELLNRTIGNAAIRKYFSHQYRLFFTELPYAYERLGKTCHGIWFEQPLWLFGGMTKNWSLSNPGGLSKKSCRCVVARHEDAK